DYEFIVHNLVAYVDGRPVLCKRALDDFDRAIDAGAETARLGEEDLHERLCSDRYFCERRLYAPAACTALHAAGALFLNLSASHISSAAPQLMAESATLKAGQCRPKAWTSKKSTTAPTSARSMTLPSAPPSTRLS